MPAPMDDGRATVARRLVLPPGVARGGAPGLAGRLVEISSTLAHAPWSYAAALVARAQGRGAACAWVQPEASEIYPPDLAAAGVDLARLLVARVPPAAGPLGAARAAEILLGSGALALLVVDVLEAPPPQRAGWQTRLLARARAAGSTVLFLTAKDAAAPSLGALCGWRLEPCRDLLADGAFALAPRWLRHRSCAGWPEVGQRVIAPWAREEPSWERLSAPPAPPSGARPA